MNSTSETIPLWNLAIAFTPALVALWICYRWSVNTKRASMSVLRMLVQLLLIGYLLTILFDTNNAWLVTGVLVVMIIASSWIALGSLKGTARSSTGIKLSGKRLFTAALLSISAGGIATLLLVTQGVLELDPWYQPRFVIPLAGMIFSSSMNTVSLAAERLMAEMDRDVSYPEARGIAFNAALIPNINSMFAVGLVSLPGMMTGQILAGTSPLIAVRYQIMVMCMIFGAATIAAACFLTLVGRAVPDTGADNSIR